MRRKILKQILFQGNLKKKNYFEGWYYKQVTKDEKFVISIIPGVSLIKKNPHSFIQYIIAKNNQEGERIKTGYFKFSLEDFSYSNEEFKVKIEENIFKETHMDINLNNEEISIKGRIDFGVFTEINKSLISPNIMGYFAYIPNMECNHGIISMNHTIKGSLIVDGEIIDFTGGKGYIEKDYGTSFPKEYLWVQSNNFKNKSTSLFLSVADIPFGGRSFRGYICNLSYEGKEYRYATYTNSKITRLELLEKEFLIEFKNKYSTLIIEGISKEPKELVAPKTGEMNIKIKEELWGVVRIFLSDRNKNINYQDIGRCAGIERVGL